MVLSRKEGGRNEGHERHTFRPKNTDRLQLAAGMAVKEFEWKVFGGKKEKKNPVVASFEEPPPCVTPLLKKGLRSSG